MRQMTEMAWLSESEMAAWRSFIETQADLVNALEADLAETGLTLGDYQVLVFLSEATDHRLRMCDLADQLQLSPSGLTRRLDGLVRDGLVERVPSEVDRRVMLAALTHRGWTRLGDAAPAHLSSVRRRIIDHLTDDELTTMATVFGKLRRALDE